MHLVRRCGSCCSQFFVQWRVWIRPVVMLSYALVLMVLIPWLVVECINEKCSQKKRTAVIGGVFVLMSIPMTLWEITQHLVHFTRPSLQQYIIRILWMVPIYGLDAWLGLLAPQFSIYCNSLRECYEAYVIYNFMKYLLNYLNSEMDLEENLERKAQVKHFFPLCCLRDWEMGKEFILKCKHGILQYTVFRPVTTLLAFICHQFGVYGEDQIKPDVAFPYIIAINNLSQFGAMYCLVLFYKANRDHLAPMKPLSKFLCIKAVVFFSFFQGVAITILVNTGVIGDVFGTTDKTDIQAISSSLQNFLICIEMFLAAIAHHYAFSHKPYVDMAAFQPNCCESFCHMWDVSDVKQDLSEHIGVMKNTVRNVIPSNIYRASGGLKEERERLLSNSEAVDYLSGNEGVSCAVQGSSNRVNVEKDGSNQEQDNQNQRILDYYDFEDLSDNELLKARNTSII